MNTQSEITKDNLLSHIIALPFIIAIALFRPTVIFVVWNWLAPTFFDITTITFLQSICLVAFFDIVSKFMSFGRNSQ